MFTRRFLSITSVPPRRLAKKKETAKMSKIMQELGFAVASPPNQNGVEQKVCITTLNNMFEYGVQCFSQTLQNLDRLLVQNRRHFCLGVNSCPPF